LPSNRDYFQAEVDAIMKNCDRDNSGTIDAAEFKEMWNFLKSEATGAANDSEKIIRDEFEKLDKNKDGYIR
jgi:Ca2+-binding EF-hand superfamily protein